MTFSNFKLIMVEKPARIQLGGNNRNLIEAIRSLYDSPELGSARAEIGCEHLFFFDVNNPKYKLMKKFYQDYRVTIGDIPEMHISLIYKLTICLFQFVHS